MDPTLLAIVLVAAVVVLVAVERRRSRSTKGAPAPAAPGTGAVTGVLPPALEQAIVSRDEFVARWASDDGPPARAYATPVAHARYSGLLGDVVALCRANGSEVPPDREHHLVCAGCAHPHAATFVLGLTGGSSGGTATCPRCGSPTSIAVRGAPPVATGTSTLRVTGSSAAPATRRDPVHEVDLVLDELRIHGRWTPDDADREVCAEALDVIDRNRPGWFERLHTHNTTAAPGLDQVHDTFRLLVALHDALIPPVQERFHRITAGRTSTSTILVSLKERMVEMTFHPSKLADPLTITRFTQQIGPDLETLLRAMGDVRR